MTRTSTCIIPLTVLDCIGNEAINVLIDSKTDSVFEQAVDTSRNRNQYIEILSEISISRVKRRM